MKLDDLIMQSIFVGIYCSILFIILTGLLSLFKIKPIYFFFILGFIKHFFGYILGLHTLFCQCFVKPNYIILFNESIIEGISFVVLFSIINNIWSKYPIWIAFSIGFILHILAEFIGLHTYLCNKGC